MSDDPMFTDLGNNTLLIHHAGYGSTPPCPQAKFKIGNVVRIRRHKARGVPQTGAVAVVVPPGIPAEYALADATGKPRPLMVTKESRSVRYIVAFADNPTPYLFGESALIATAEKDVEIKFSETAT